MIPDVVGIMTRSTLAVSVALLLGGCATAPIQLVSPDGSRLEVVKLEEWLRAHPVAAGQAIRIDELGRSESASFHVVQVRTREQPHLHQTHDAVVQVQRGGGTFFLGPRRLRLVPGSIVNIPRGVAHYFINESCAPTVAFVVFSPPFDGTDIVLVTQPSHPTPSAR